jgi:hypothetical protein
MPHDSEIEQAPAWLRTAICNIYKVPNPEGWKFGVRLLAERILGWSERDEFPIPGVHRAPKSGKLVLVWSRGSRHLSIEITRHDAFRIRRKDTTWTTMKVAEDTVLMVGPDWVHADLVRRRLAWLEGRD